MNLLYRLLNLRECVICKCLAKRARPRVRDMAISWVRSFWYGLYEPIALETLRGLNEQFYENWGYGDDPLVSVYVPTHNRADLLIERSLKSIRAQTYTNLEIIVVADNCTDNTIAKVCALRGVDKRIKLVHNYRPKSFPHKAENYWFAGRADPANVGLAHCKGAFIATNDDDDIWTSDHIETLLRFAQHNDLEFVSAAHDLKGHKVKPYDLDGVKVGGVQTWLMRSYLKSFKWNRQCWRKRWNRVSDTDIQQRFHNAGVRMGYLDKVVTHIVPRPGETQTGLQAYLADPAKTERHFA